MQFEVRPQEARLYVIAAAIHQAMTRGGTYPANRQGLGQSDYTPHVTRGLRIMMPTAHAQTRTVNSEIQRGT